MKLLLFKCNYDHLFRKVSCPYDGWTHPDIRKIEQLFAEGRIAVPDQLREFQIDEDLVRRVIIIDSLEYDDSLEGIAIGSIVVRGNVVEKGNKQ